MSEYIIEVTDGWKPIDTKEEIVRCRDCKQYTDDDMEYYHYCGNWCGQVEPDGFCKWGERMEQ